MATQDDINRIHGRLDEILKKQNDTNVSVARIEENMQAHYREHEKEDARNNKKSDRVWNTVTRWLNPIAIVTALWALIKIYFGSKSGG